MFKRLTMVIAHIDIFELIYLDYSRGIYSSLYASKWDRKEIDRFVNSGRKLSQGKEKN